MAYRIGSATTFSTASQTTTTYTINSPIGVQLGDIIIIANLADDNQTLTSVSSPGFTSGDFKSGAGIQQGPNFGMAWLYKVATGSEPASYTITLNHAPFNWITAFCAAWTGRNTSTPITANANTTLSGGNSPVSYALNGVTAASGDDLIWIGMDTGTSAGITWTNPAGFSTGIQINGGASGGDSYFAYKNATGAGATGTITGTETGINSDVLGFVIALAVAPPAGSFGTNVATSILQITIASIATQKTLALVKIAAETLNAAVTLSNNILQLTSNVLPTIITTYQSSVSNLINATSNLYNITISGGSTIPNITSLASNFPTSDTAAYNALSIGAQSSGYSWNDTVTGAKTWKLTANGTPATGMFCPWYSEMGLAISQPWGANNDQYHVAFVNVFSGGGDGYVCDFGLSTSTTPGPYNFRALPSSLYSYSSGVAAFSRKAGNPHIMYILTSGGKLQLYNVSTGVFVDSSAASLGYSASWPAAGWSWTTSINEWIMVNANESWVGGRSATTMYALNLNTGTTQTWAPASGVDDAYMGYGNYMTGDAQTQVWDLDANIQIDYGTQLTAANGWTGGQVTSHMAIMRGVWAAFNTQGSSVNPMPVATVAQGNPASVVIGTTAVTPYDVKYWGQFHPSGHWWLQTPGTNQYFLQSNFLTPAGAPGPASEQYAISFANPWTGTLYRLGFAYSDYNTITGTGTNYWTQPHAHISHDGKLVIFGSDMLGTSRIDLFAMEVPLMLGSPPSFP